LAFIIGEQERSGVPAGQEAAVEDGATRYPAFTARASGNLLFIASRNASLSAAVIFSSGASRPAFFRSHVRSLLMAVASG
jgi:hypothetical protein